MLRPCCSNSIFLEDYSNEIISMTVKPPTPVCTIFFRSLVFAVFIAGFIALNRIGSMFVDSSPYWMYAIIGGLGAAAILTLFCIYHLIGLCSTDIISYTVSYKKAQTVQYVYQT